MFWTNHAIERAGARALLAPKERSDVVLLDLSLPGMSGIETARLLKEELDGTRLIALSMHEDRNCVQRFRR